MGVTYRPEPDIPLHITQDDVRKSKCADPTRCTLSLGGERAVGVPIRVTLEGLVEPEVKAIWDVDGRHHRAHLRPVAQAIQLLLLTDKNKIGLTRRMPKEGMNLMMEEHSSAPSQKRTAAQKEVENQRRRKLEEDRASGLVPPKKPRSRSTTFSPRTSKGYRGLYRAS